jgi:hypothetical protein
MPEMQKNDNRPKGNYIDAKELDRRVKEALAAKADPDSVNFRDKADEEDADTVNFRKIDTKKKK